MILLRTRVKICGLTTVEDVKAVVSAGADAVGFVFYPPSPRAVTAASATELVAQVPAFVTKVGLFVDEDPLVVKQIASELKLDLLQFHGNETPAYCRQFDRTYIKAVRVKPGLNLIQYAQDYHDAAGLLLDAYVPGIPGGTGERFDWGVIPSELGLPLILAGGLDVENISGAIRQVRPWAVDVSGGVERQKGLKDHQKVAAFMAAVNQA